jgi:hypothetical protein
MKNRIAIFLVCIFFSMVSCDKSDHMRNRFLGTWNVKLFQRECITQAGSEVLYSKQDAGYITFEAPFSGEAGQELNFFGSLEQENGTSEIEGSGQIDDEASRWIIYNGECSGFIGCDLTYTITKSTTRKLEVFTMAYSGTPGQHYKLTLKMSK